jgi:hypothetical protein
LFAFGVFDVAVMCSVMFGCLPMMK